MKSRFSLGRIAALVLTFGLVLAGCDNLTGLLNPLKFTDSPSYDIPESTVGTEITGIYVGGNVSGGTPPYSFMAIGLPAGITISSDGTISGEPTTPGSEGTATITVTDSAGMSQSITIKYGAINPGSGAVDPLIFPDNPIYDIPAGTVGNPITSNYIGDNVSGGTPPYSFMAIGLPAGISIFSDLGVISGMYAAETPGGTATIYVTDSAGAVQSISINYGAVTSGAGSGTGGVLTFTDSPSYDIPPSTAGREIAGVYVGGGVSGGTPPYTFTAPGLPAGINISTAGVIWGKAAAAAAGGTVTVYVTDSAGARQSITINYDAITGGSGSAPGSPLTFTDSSSYDIPAATVGTEIMGIYVGGGVSGGTRPYTFTATGLPAGISIIPELGVISGMHAAEAAGGTATIHVTDSAGATRNITINYGRISAGDSPGPAPGSPLTFTDSPNYDISSGTVGSAISGIYVGGGASGGTRPYTFTATGLPEGITISTAGVISGIPTAAAAAGMATIYVTDSAGVRQSITINYDAITSGGSGPDTTPPADVTGLMGTAGNGQVTLNWTNPGDSDFTHVEISWTPGGGTPITYVGTMRTISSLANGTTYTFTVKSVDSTGNKSMGVTVLVTPAGTAPPPDTTPPANVTSLAGTAGDGQVTLNWTNPGDSDFTHVEISWTPGGGTPITYVGTMRTISSLANGTTYTFTVKSVDSTGNKSTGVTVLLTPAGTAPPPDTTPPANVTGLTGTAGDGQVTLNWINPGDSDFTHVEISWTPDGGTRIVNVGTTETAIKDLANGMTYTFTVKSVDSTGNKSEGVTVSVIPRDSAGSLPGGLSLNESLDWLVANATEGGVYTITLSGDEAIAPGTLSYNGKTVSITLEGGTAERTVSLSSNGPLFTVGSGVTLKLGSNITLRGQSSNTDAVVRVESGGTLEMNSGSKIGGNANAYGPGGGVYINGGAFTMNGGEISGNTASYGGGVYVYSGAFTKQPGGVIYGEDGSGTLKNTANGYSYGHAVYVSADKIRNSTAGEGVTLDSSSSGSAGGWVEQETALYTVTFDADGGTPADQTLTVNSGGSAGSSMPQEPTRSGYAFGGWYTEVNGGGNRFTADTPITGNIRVYANWLSQVSSVQVILRPAPDGPALSTKELSIYDSAEFSAGNGYASYTWYWDGEAIPGETWSTYSLAANSKESGVYELSVVVVTGAGEKLSARCRVDIIAY